MVRQFIILILLLASASFFQVVVIPRQLLLVLSFGGSMFMAVAILVGIIYNKLRGFRQNFSFEVSLFLISAIFGMFGAYWGHGQSFLLSFWIQQGMYYYLFYYFLHLIRIKPEDFKRLLIIMALAFAFIYIVQYAIFPIKIIDVRASESRGTVRIFMPGLLFAEMIFYYFLQRLFKTNNLKYLGFIGVYIVIVVLLGTRQVLAITGFGVLVLLLISSQVKSRALMFTMVLASGALIFIIFQDIFIQLIEVSKEQSAQEGDDIRVRSATFFLTEFQPLFITYITGNGEGHLASAYGMKMWYYKSIFSFYQSDVGIIGSYSMYGILSVLAFILIIRKIFIIKVEPEYRFIKFWTVTLVFHSILGWPFFKTDGIAVIMGALYLLDVSNYNLRQKTLEPVPLPEKQKDSS